MVASRRRGSPDLVVILMAYSEVSASAGSSTQNAQCSPQKGLPKDLLPAVAGYAFGFLVEKKDLPVHVMGNDSFFKIVQDRLQVILMADYIFK